jgi:2-polyprenyl-6-methoxyphenol hydroxylase-like FAD-dependent oxidoreductase
MEHLGNYDVVIVGGRVAGAATAILLARTGIRVLLLEQSQHLPPIVSTHLLHPYGLASLYRLCLREQFESEQPKIPYMSIFFGENILRARVTPVEDIDYMTCPDRDWLDNLLLDQCRTQPNLELVMGFKVSKLLRNSQGKVIGVEGRYQGTPTCINASLVIGADGKQSIVARESESKVHHQQQMKRSGFYGYFRNFQWLDGPSVEFYVDREQFYAFPMRNGLTCLVAGIPQEKDDLFKDGIEKGLRAVFAESPIAHRVQDIQLVGTAMGIKAKAHKTFIRQCVGYGWALVGDASVHTDPMLGQGMGLALRGAEALSNIIIAGYYKQNDVNAFINEYGRWRNGALWDMYYVISSISRDLTWGSQPWERLLQKRAIQNPDTAAFIYSMMNQLVRPVDYFRNIIPVLVTGRGAKVTTNRLPKLPYSEFVETLSSPT